jgi:hypothetical protein
VLRAVRQDDEGAFGGRAAGQEVQHPQARLVGVVGVIDDKHRPGTGRGQVQQLRRGREQSLMALQADPGQGFPRQRTFDLLPEPVL